MGITTRRFGDDAEGVNFRDNRQSDRTAVSNRHSRTGTSQGTDRGHTCRLVTGNSRQQISDCRQSEALSSQHRNLRRGGARFSREDQDKSFKTRGAKIKSSSSRQADQGKIQDSKT